MSEIIVVRSLKDSDLGIFASHRSHLASKQRAININSEIAKKILHPDLFKNNGSPEMPCICVFQGVKIELARSFEKVHKNWRLGGSKLEENIFSSIDACDFLLLKSNEHNSGTSPITFTFVSRNLNLELHKKLVSMLEDKLNRSMAIFEEHESEFIFINQIISSQDSQEHVANKPSFLPVPNDEPEGNKEISPRLKIRRKVRSPHILEEMYRIAGDFSANSQFEFLSSLEEIAFILREILINQNKIIALEKNHTSFWKGLSHQTIGFVDGGLANLSMLGSAPIAARVGCYVVTPGKYDEEREKFNFVSQMIDELYTSDSQNGVYSSSFPDIGALRDAARISIEAGGAVKALQTHQNIDWLFLHGALVNPVSRYSDIMQDGEVISSFPSFSTNGIEVLLDENSAQTRVGKDANFISVYLEQLKRLQSSNAVVCGIVERESSSTSVIQNIVAELSENEVSDLLSIPLHQFKIWFQRCLDNFRFTDALLFKCILEAGEAIAPVSINRNDLRKAPLFWQDTIQHYPIPWVSYIKVSEWSVPFRIEFFEKDIPNFESISKLVYHCSLLLPRYAFPVGLDIADKFAKIPNWMAKPINTHTAVQALTIAINSGQIGVVDSMRKLLCGSQRDWLFRPKLNN